MDRETFLAVWLHYGTGHNGKLFHRIQDSYPDLEEAYAAAQKRQSTAFSKFTPEVSARLFEAADPKFMERYIGWLTRHNISVLTIDAPEYPALLAEIDDAPPLLFVRGKLPSSPPLPIGVIGARACSDHGKLIAKHFGRALAENGATVITGMAEGIDSHAAIGALDSQNAACPVIGVLGCGIDVVYPPNGKAVFEAVAERGAIITEFLPKTPPLPYHFPLRNRIVSGLSRGILVVEAAERSGASITANLALEQGRDVFAVPGRITDPQSVGTNRMLVNGEAKPVICAADILIEYDSTFLMTQEDNRKSIPFSTLEPRAQAVYHALYTGEKNIDTLQEMTGISVSELNSVLTAMQFAGIIRQSAGRMLALDTLQVNVVLDS